MDKNNNIKKEKNKIIALFKNKKFIGFLIGFIILVVAIIVILNVFVFNKELKTLRLENEKVYFYFLEEKFDFTGNITFDHEDNITKVTLDNKEQQLFSEPVYFQNKKQILIPTNYNYVIGSTGVQKKINYYTLLENMDEDYYLSNKNLDYKMSHDFLYDGEDMYIFVDNATVKFQDQEILITPMSYVYYQYNSHALYIYNYEEDNVYFFEDISSDIFVENEYYKVNLSADSLVINGKDKLLMKNFDYLEKLK